MQKSQLARFLIIAAITLGIIVIAIIVLNETMDFQRAQFMSSVEVSIAWIIRFAGLSLLVFSVISLVIAGINTIELKNFTKWAILIMLAMLIMHPAWYLVFGAAIILATLIVVEYLKSNKTSSENQTPQ